MKILLQYLKNYKELVALAFGLTIINQIFSLLDPYFYGRLIDLAVHHSKDESEVVFLKSIGILIGGALGVAMVSRIAKAFQDYFLNLIIQKFGAAVYTDGLKHSLQLPYQEFEDQRSGTTLNILQRVRTDSEKFMTYFLNVFFFGIVGIVFVMIYSAFVYGTLVVVYFIACAVLYFVINYLSKKIKLVQSSIVKETNVLAGATTESLRNIELIKSLGLTNQEIKRLNLATLRILQLELKKVRTLRSINFVQGTLVNFLRQGILFVLLYLVFKDKFSLGHLATLQMYSFFIFNPLQEMGNVILSYREAEASLQNFAGIMSKPLDKKVENPILLKAIEKLAFQDVSFQHKTARNKALNHINFQAYKGETIAFVGPSGSGKTTLVKLLVGLYKPQEGSILYNDNDSLLINIDEVRNQIGFVTQDTQLFAGTIKENLLFVNPRASDAEITDVLHKASCMNLLVRSDNGINTVIGEGGMKVSGGEKQRLSIARALLRNPNLLVFDEATSALDSITEEEISNTIRTISQKKNHITVMIAHRLSTILHADRIYVLEKGEIVETGKHETLIAEKGLYYAMWRQQIGERKEEG